jgi:hypothetical protein
MKKQLNVDQIQSELRGGSAFFPGYKGGDTSNREPVKPEPAVSPPPQPSGEESKLKVANKPMPLPQRESSLDDTTTPRHHDTTQP